MSNYINIERMFADTVQKVVDGELDALEVYAKMKQFNNHLQDCIKAVQEEAIREAERYGEKSFEHKGMSFEFREGRRTYDFKHIPEWVEEKNKLKEIEKRAKTAAHMNGTFVDEDGAVVEPCIIKHSSPSLIVKNK